MAKVNTKNNTTYRLVLSAIMVALSVLLSFISVYQLPMGGSITLFSMVPIVIVSWLFGVPWGLLTGFVCSLIFMMVGFSNFGYVSGMLSYVILVLADYVVPFTMIGLGGIFKNKFGGKTLLEIGVGAFMVGVIRFICHFISGITIWGAFASDDTMSAIVAYSATYNGSYMLPETILTVIGAVLIAKFLFPRLDENGMIKNGKKA